MKQFLYCSTLFLILKSVCSTPTQILPTQEDAEMPANPTPTSQEEQVNTTEPRLPNEPYDCSIFNTTLHRARAVASFKKGLSLIVDELNDRVLQVKLLEHIECCNS